MHDPTGPVTPRRRRVTEETMIEAGIELTLPKLTVKSVAEKLGVSIVAIYNNIDDVEALKGLVAEAILRRWDFPEPTLELPIHDALLSVAMNLRALVHRNPGIAQYLVNIDADSPDALAKIDAVQQRYATVYGLRPKQAMWAVATVAEHAIALAEMVHVTGRRQNQPAMADRTDLTLIPRAVDRTARSLDADFELSMRAVVLGAIAVIDDPQFETF